MSPPRRAATIAVALSVGLAGVVAFMMAFTPKPVTVPGTPSPSLVSSGETYQLSDFKVRFPVEPPPSEEGPVAVVDFDSTWSDGVFPGEASCTIELLDEQGAVVESHETGFAHMEPSEHFSLTIPAAEGSPSRARGTCGPGMVFRGSSYLFDNVRVAGDRVIADVRWSAGTPVGLAACAARIVTPDGDVSIHTVTLGTGPGKDLVVMLLGRSYAGGMKAAIRCEPYQSPEQEEPSYWLPWQG